MGDNGAASELVGWANPALARPPVHRRRVWATRSPVPGLDIPRHMWDDVYERPSPGGTIALLRVGGASPARPIRDLESAASLGLGLSLGMPAGASLEILRPFIHKLRALEVHHGPVRHTSVLEEAHELVDLRLGAESLDAFDVGHLRSLRAFFGRGESGRAVLCNPFVEKIEFYEPPVFDQPIVGQVRDLTFSLASRLTSLPSLEHPEGVRRLVLDGLKRLTLDLSGYQSLTRLELRQVGRIDNFGTIAQLTNLRDLVLLDVRRIDEPGRVPKTLRSLRLEPAEPVPEHLRRLWNARGWDVPA